MSRLKTFAAVAALGLGASACAPTNEPLSAANNPSVYSVHQPVVQRTDFVLDLSSGGGNLSPQERQRLDAWLVSIGAGYGDSLYIDEPAGYPNVAVRDDIARVAADYGLALGEGAPVLNGEVPPGTIRVIASRSTASVPSCPDWSEDGSDPASAELTSSNFGCAMNSNLAAMVAHPDDLIVGRDGTSAGSGTTATRAVGTYRRAQPTGSQPLPSTSTTTGNQ
jgi:pilus assembly protein CpaD